MWCLFWPIYKKNRNKNYTVGRIEMIKTVFLDIDGVLANFRKGIHDAFNKPYDYLTLSKKWKFWDDWPDVTFEMVNAACNIKFWAGLEWIHDGKDILMAIRKIFNSEDIYLLTTPMPNIESSLGKEIWIDAWLPEYVKRTIITRTSKHLLARPDTLLIDDKNENVDGFRKVGGKAVLINRPWNAGHKRANHTVEDLKNELKKYT